MNTLSLELRTVPLSKSIIRQMRWLTYEEAMKHPESILGWIHGVVLGKDYEDDTFLLLQTGEGDYALFNVLSEERRKYKQIYVP